MPDKRNLLPLTLLIALSLIWGSSFILMKKGLVVFSPQEVALLRIVAAFFFLLPFSLTKIKKIRLNNHVKLLASGLMGVFIPAFLFTMAQQHLDSSMAGIFNSLTPIWTIIVGALFFAERLTPYALAGIMAGSFGMYALMQAHAEENFLDFNPYALLLVAATFLYGCNLNFVKHKIQGIPPLTMTGISTFWIGIFSVIGLFGFTEFTTKLTTAPGAWKAFAFVVILGCMSTAVAVVMLYRLIIISSPLYAGSVTYLIPVVAVVIGIFDGEALTQDMILGMLAVMSGVYLINKKKKSAIRS